MQFINLIINIAATMILGMSNTYQQLITSLEADEVRWVLSTRGDSRVGTNSPLAINHKKTGKSKAWLAWLLLILTSLVIVQSSFSDVFHASLTQCLANTLSRQFRHRTVRLFNTSKEH